MVNLNRRFFLGGAISLVAAQTFVPSVSAMMNLPTIYGDGKNDDTYGLGALFRNEPVTFNKEQIGIDSHDGLTFHQGFFKITNSIHIPKNSKITIDPFAVNPPNKINFYAPDLDSSMPVFICEDSSGTQFNDTNWVIFHLNTKHVGKIISMEDESDKRRNADKFYQTIRVK